MGWCNPSFRRGSCENADARGLDRFAPRLIEQAGVHAEVAVPIFARQAEYLADFVTTSKQLVQLAGAAPAEKYSWRPPPGVRSVSEVYVHIASGNYLLTAMAGAPLPSTYVAKPTMDVRSMLEAIRGLERSVVDKDKMVAMLQASLDGVRDNFGKLRPEDLERAADFFGPKTTVRRIYLRIFAHDNEHRGQSIGYARMIGVVPPWSNQKVVRLDENPA